ncbi:MAG: hypothetical protein JWL77_1558, partial [Chthonomonadaceae bacterium]|nr:hypothetical protein [Chthonomonadaceae bacterium]
GVSEGVSAAVLKALSKRPEERYGSCREFVQALIEGAAKQNDASTVGMPLSVPPLSGSQALPKGGGIGSRVGVVTLAVIVTAGIGLIAVALTRPHAEQAIDSASTSKNSGTSDPSSGVSSTPTTAGGADLADNGPSTSRNTDTSVSTKDAPTTSGEQVNSNSAVGVGVSTSNTTVTADSHPASASPAVSPSLQPAATSPVDHASDHNPSEIRWAHYKDPTGGYQIEYPEGWTCTRDVNSARVRTTFTAPEPGVSFLVDTGVASSADPYKNWREMDRSFRSSYKQKYQLLGLTRTSQGSASPALWQFILTPSGHSAIEKSDFGLVQGRTGYAVLASAPPDRWGDWESPFKHIRESLQISAFQAAASTPSERVSQPSSAFEYSEVSERRLTAADLGLHSDAELRLMRNTIYAKHNYLFANPEMSVYFTAKSWYHGDCNKADVVYDRFSRIEKSNATFILDYQKAHKGAAIPH